MLTIDDYRNILQLLNRVQLQGNEAAVFVMLTHRINEEIKSLDRQQNGSQRTQGGLDSALRPVPAGPGSDMNPPIPDAPSAP